MYLCNSVSLIAPPKFYFQKPTVVEILITNLMGHFLFGHPVQYLLRLALSTFYRADYAVTRCLTRPVCP